MVVIRLSRGGSKKRPFYHVVAADRRMPRDGRYIELLGYFNPIARGEDKRLHVEQERLQHWLSVGAQTSHRVSLLLKELTASKSHAEKRAAHQAKRQAKAEVERKAAAEAAAKEAEAGETADE